VIEYITAQRVLDETVGIAFAYYDYQSSELFTVTNIITALVKQLCRKKRAIPSGFLKTKQDALPPSQLGDGESFTMAAAQFQENFLILDALDECAKADRYKILEFLRQIVNDHRLFIKVFITSRREGDIESEFRRLNRPTIMVEARSVAADISKYVSDETRNLRQGRGGKRLYVKSDALELKIIETLTEKADGMYVLSY
jgi:ankyrin repeat domain-containing protein 50